MSAVERAVSWFVEPAVPAAAAPPAVCPGARAAVLGRAGRAEPVAAALALALRGRERAGAAVLAVLGPAAAGQPRAATAAARRLVAQLEAHGVEAVPRGRLAWATLPAEEELHAVAAARRASALGAPTVLAVTAPRSESVDELLAEQDLLVIVAGDPGGPLAALAAAGLGAVPAETMIVPPLAPGPRRALALAGIAAGPAGRRLAEALAAASRVVPW